MTEVKKSAIRVFLEGLKTYWGIATTLVAILSFAYARGVTSGNAGIISKVDSLVVNVSALTKSQDAVITGQETTHKDMTKVVTVVKNLSSELIKHESKDPTVTKNDIVNIMNGLQFEISQPAEKSIDPDLRIVVKKYIK
jgi:hypothetical protein